MDVGGGGAGTPGSTGKGRGRKAAAGGPKPSGLGRGAGAKGASDASPGKPAVGAGAGPSAAPAAPAAAGGSGAGPSTAAAAGVGAAGGVVKKRTRQPKAAKAAAEGAGNDSGPEDAPDTSMPYRGTFTKELSRLMYGFGDTENPFQETINLVEDIVVEYVRDTCCAALNDAFRMGKLDRGSKLKIDEKDIQFLMRKDPKKYGRIRELLEMQVLIKEARKAIDVDAVDLAAEKAREEGAGGGGAEEAGEELGDVRDEDLEVE